MEHATFDILHHNKHALNEVNVYPEVGGTEGGGFCLPTDGQVNLNVTEAYQLDQQLDQLKPPQLFSTHRAATKCSARSRSVNTHMSD